MTLAVSVFVWICATEQQHGSRAFQGCIHHRMSDILKFSLFLRLFTVLHCPGSEIQKHIICMSVCMSCDDTSSKQETKPSKSSASANIMKAWLNTSVTKRSADTSTSAEEMCAHKKPKIE